MGLCLAQASKFSYLHCQSTVSQMKCHAFLAFLVNAKRCLEVSAVRSSNAKNQRTLHGTTFLCRPVGTKLHRLKCLVRKAANSLRRTYRFPKKLLIFFLSFSRKDNKPIIKLINRWTESLQIAAPCLESC